MKGLFGIHSDLIIHYAPHFMGVTFGLFVISYLGV